MQKSKKGTVEFDISTKLLFKFELQNNKVNLTTETFWKFSINERGVV